MSIESLYWAMTSHLVELFNKLKAILKEYEGEFTPKYNEEGKYDLWSIRDVEIAGRKRKEVYFAGLIVRKKYVGFYYMPLYAEKDLGDVFDPELLSLLKGKSCFHVREMNDRLEKQIRKALKVGFKLYQERDWV